MVVWEYAADDAKMALEARANFCDALRNVPLDCDGTCVEVIFSELVSNVIKHAPGPIAVTFEMIDERAFLRVCDRGPGFVPHITVPTDLLAEGGRGLLLVQHFCNELKVEISNKAGTCVSAVFVLPSGASTVFA